MRRSVIRENPGVELLFLHFESSHLRWFEHLVRIPPGYLPKEGVLTMSNWVEAPGQTQGTWERLHLSAGLDECIDGRMDRWMFKTILLGRVSEHQQMSQ